jgi:hypothetical protein
MIKIEDGKYVLYSEDGRKRLGEFDSEEEALRREKEILRIMAAREEASLDERAQAVRDAYYETVNEADRPNTWCEGVFEDYLIVARDGKYYRVPYSISDQGYSFGDPVEVEKQYVAVSEALEALAPKGKRWEVRLIREGPNKKNPPWIYTRKALETLLRFVDGAPLRAVESLPGVFGHEGRASKVIGKLINPRATESAGFYEPRAEAEIDETYRDWLVDQMRAGHVNGVSINAPVEAARLPSGLVWVMRFLGLESVDLATAPAAGGAFLRATESVAKGDGEMKVEDILALLKRCKRDDLIARLGDHPTIERAAEALSEALSDASSARTLSAQEAQEIRALRDQMIKDSCEAYLTRKLAEIRLPEPVKKKIEKQFGGKVFAREALDEAVALEQETLDQLARSGLVLGAGDTRVEVGQEAVDKHQIAMDRMLGVKAEGDPGLVFRSLRQAYVAVTGDSEVRGYIARERLRSQEAIIAADFPSLLGTSMNRRLLQDYAAAEYGERRIISPPILTLENFKLQEAERVGYFGDLSTVDPETADYVEATKPGEEKISFTPLQKGNLLTITRKAIMNDDLRGLTRRVQGWGRAARRTFARYIWNFWVSNATYTGDGTAWFTVGHGNLGATALSAASLSSAVDVLAKMTELSSNERLGLSDRSMQNLLLVVPQELRATAYKVNQAEYLDANFTPNDMYQIFGANNERILVNPLLTDVNDWGLFRDPNEVDIMIVGFINGQEEPEMFLADQPTVGQMFVADKLQWKIRHEYGAMIGDYRGAFKAQV